MPTSEFTVIATKHFARDYQALLKGHADLTDHYTEALHALKQDPYNRTRRYPIKKLRGVAPGDGQYRFRSGRFRFRYDIETTNVFLKVCSLRREDTY